jgi:hypothetical protein
MLRGEVITVVMRVIRDTQMQLVNDMQSLILLKYVE